MPSSTKLTRALVDTAMGRIPADLVIRNGQWVSVQSGEIDPSWPIIQLLTRMKLAHPGRTIEQTGARGMSRRGEPRH